MSDGWRIVEDDLSDPKVHALLNTHLSAMYATSPPESVHALDLGELRSPDVTLWTAWDGDDLMGCAALKALDDTHGEVKSMRTSERHLRRGVAAALLAHLLDVARRRGYTRVSLETGPEESFGPARRLYTRFGFVPCEAYGSYPADDPFSSFFTLEL